ncbi:MAG: ACP S-malonyltransferase [Rhodospirillales bacterium]
MTKRAFVFPGQGSQHVGMGKALAEAFAPARAVFEEVDEALGQDLSALIFEGPEDELTLTENAQPALLAVSLAVIRTLKEDGGFDLADGAAFVAGHSLGEYSGLAAAGAFSLADAARLLKARGQAMQRAAPVGEGAMAAVLGLEIEAVEEVAAQVDGICAIANDNSPGQVVVSGERAAVEAAAEAAREKGAKRCLMLPVSAPFHCPMMAPAAEVMREALADADISPPSVPLVANVSASAVSEPGEIRRLLVEQVTGRVRWRESVLYMRDRGVGEMVEAGPGKVLSGLARRIDRDLSSINIATPEDMEEFLKTV